MSYSIKLKEEILKKDIDNIEDIYAELFGIFLAKNSFNNYGLEFKTENLKLAKRVYQHILKVTGIKAQIKYTIAKRFFKPKVYLVSIINTLEIEEKYSKFLKEMFKFKQIGKYMNIESIIRGFFLTSGYIKDPVKGYNLDFFIDSEDSATFLYLLLKHINKKVFQTEKKNKTIVYIRNSEDILDLIHIFGSLNIFFKYEEVTIQKEIKNKINRTLNYELANETKKISTSIKQIEMIEFIEEKMGIENLSYALFQLAKLRLENDSDSFQELAHKLGISKSGVRNRFSRLEEIYLKLKG